MQKPLLSSVVVLILGGAAFGQPTEERSAAFRATAIDAAASYEFRLDEHDGPLDLVREPVLRWSNPVSGDWDGYVFLWTDDGLPRVIASIYKAYHREGEPVSHEFHSLSEQAFVGQRDGVARWTAPEAGITWKPVPQAPAPAASAGTRLVQMRTLARQFEVVKTGRDDVTRNLRLLNQPLFRSQSQKSDGAVFNFAQTSDPEVLLLLEVRESGGRQRWEYAFARMNSVEFRATLDDAEVWHAPAISWQEVNDHTRAYTVYFRQ